MKKISILLLGSILAACAGKPPADSFEAAWNEGQHNERETADGSRYMREMVVGLGPALTDSEAQCKTVSNEPKYPSVRLVMKLDLSGAVTEAIVRPSNARWECVKDSLAKKRFPAPPRDSFWTSGDIRQ